jgi:hypothetical protein
MPTNAYKDENGVSTMIGVLNTDGKTITRIKANPTNHGLKYDDDTTGSDYGTPNAKHDENGVRCLMAVSSVDGSPVALYINSEGQLLVKST